MLFFSGTRDSLCSLEKLTGVLNRLSAPWELNIIEGGDHSFRTPKSMGISETEVYSNLLYDAVVWLES
jgi:hypothetical protein